jgi:predicted PurR-regulated permease PerM
MRMPVLKNMLMPILKKYPFYIRVTIILLGLVLASYALANLQDILIPFSYALFLAILLNPLVNLLERWRIPKVVSIAIALLIAIILIGTAWYLLAVQVSHFTARLPELEQRTADLVSRLQQQLSAKIPIDKQNHYIADAKAGIEPLIGRALGSAAGTLITISLIPVYTFLLLYYRTLILNFIYEIFAEQHEGEVRTVLQQARGAIQSYMYGLVIRGVIVAAMNTIALLLLGVPYAVLLGVLGAILNVLPLFGGVLAALLAMAVATLTKEGIHTQVLIAACYAAIQFTDNHFLIPYIVGSKVKINALISVIAVLLGAAVWGFSGMIVAIPFIGILKIIFDRIPEMQPWGRLLGTEMEVRKRRPPKGAAGGGGGHPSAKPATRKTAEK